MSPSSMSLAGRPAAANIGGRGLEPWYFVAAYLVCNGARWIFIGDLSAAQEHACWIVNLEQSAAVAVEASAQAAFDLGPVRTVLANIYLAAQLLVLPGALIWLFRRSRPVYGVLRTTVITTWMLAVPIFALFRVAPPRLAGLGMADTVSAQAAFSLAGHSTIFYNPYAAVPSLHVGFAFAIGIAVAAVVTAPWAKALAWAWGPIVTLAVVATANHYVFDVAAGLVITLTGLVLGRWITGAWRSTRRGCAARRRRRRTRAARASSATPHRPLAGGCADDPYRAARRPRGDPGRPRGDPRARADLVFVGAAADEDELWPLLRRARPTLVVLDIDHPGRNGLSLSLVLKRQIAPPRVVVHSSLPPRSCSCRRDWPASTRSSPRRTRAGTCSRRCAPPRRAAPAEIPAAARAHAAAQLDATDRAILAMVLASTAERDIAATIGIPRAGLARRLYAIVMRLAPTAAEARDVVERHREPAIGEALERAAQDPLAVALGVAA